ncbi:hypothetical protein CWI37_0082p0020 [Hamiltosporidium tvaerminnensis]|uniref:Uncharacterized protein n=1 Tax=Hamiltosporidium tvaerminnensis TaxID=1176355 RepID=A0A4Q9LBW2_9MICR|nr:hypothetical protein CWI37_0238p0010 [Hamiltosporidium tvaerminnensis]TBU04835.1 hypothetical protein CWI37_0082p0020 [Hamiltosporidium tvaerminnensis]
MKTVETISFDRRRGLDNDVECSKHLKTKNITSLFSKRGTPCEELAINIRKKYGIEEETVK